MSAGADILWPLLREASLLNDARDNHADMSAAAAAEVDHDLALLRRVGAGDAAAYRALCDRYLARIVGFASRLLGGAAADAEDVAQETFLRLWTQASRFEAGKAKPSTWLYRIAHNACVDRLRKQRPADARALERQSSGGDRPNAELARKETAERVNAALQALPERQRSAITLVHYEGLGNLEAAEVLGVSVEALESLLSRGRRALRAALAELRASEGEGV
jgi:RNA polymerase sigma-70 factor (ECF subfamily)